MNLNLTSILYRTRIVAFLLGFVCLFLATESATASPFAIQHDHNAHERHRAYEYFLETGHEDVTKNEKSSNHQDNKKHQVAQRKRGITSYFIKKSVDNTWALVVTPTWYTAYQYNSYRKAYQRPSYYVHLFRYALF